MKLTNFNATMCQLTQLLMITIIINITDGHTSCPDGCVCSTSGTVICDGLEMGVVLPHHMNNKLADSKIQRFLQKLIDGRDSVLYMENFRGKFDESVTDMIKSVHCDCQLIHDYKPSDIDKLICRSPPEFLGKNILEASRIMSCPKNRKKRQGWHTPPPDVCEPNPCMHHGNCIPNGKTFSCVCLLDYTGKNCEMLITRDDPDASKCISNPCRNQAQCMVHDGNLECVCPEGFTGLYCETRLEVNQNCDSVTCQNGGTCIADRAGSMICICTSQYTGDHCEIVNPCASNPCLNQGKCNSDESGNYRCSCLQEYSGLNCEFLMADPCASAPCLNSGVCTVDVRNGGGYKCKCAEEYGYQGKRCEMQLKVKILHATDVSISTTWDFVDPNRLPVYSFEIIWRAQDKKKSESHEFLSATVAPYETGYKIDRLQPSTGYEVCVRVVFSEAEESVKICVESGTYPTDHNPGSTSSSKQKPLEDESEFHTYGLIVFGTGTVICAIAIIVVAVLYHKRVQSSKNTHLSPVSSTTTPPSLNRPTISNAHINDIQLRIAVPDTIPIVNVTEPDEISSEIFNEMSADQQNVSFNNKTFQTIHEESDVSLSHTNSSPRTMVNGDNYYPTDSNLNYPILGVESDI